MSGPDEFDFTEEPTSEVELSAQDLLKLSPSNKVVQLRRRATPSAAGGAKEPVPTIPPSVPMQAVAASVNRRMLPASRVALALSVAAAALVVVVALYKYSTPDPHVQSSATTWPPTAAPEESLEEAATTADSGRQVVRFANPFDESEVFEFPSGTSRADARAAVADLLMKRAMERQTLLDARLSQRR